FGHSLARVLQRRRAVDHRPRRVDPRLEIGQLERDRLVARDWLAERAALVRPTHGVLEAALREPDAHRGNTDASTVKRCEKNAGATTALAEHRVRRDSTI